jgi:hypothetical protein
MKDMIKDIYSGLVALVYLGVFAWLLYLGGNALYHWLIA